MACFSMRKPGQTLEQRMAQAKAALKRLEAKLQAGQVRLNIAPNGAVQFAGWQDRDDISDVCAYRTLSAEGSSALRMAVARAEAMQGRKVNPNAVAAGWHSHDGKRWETH
jgi:hypothetical protein